jgi:hypothetical protein
MESRYVRLKNAFSICDPYHDRTVQRISEEPVIEGVSVDIVIFFRYFCFSHYFDDKQSERY